MKIRTSKMVLAGALVLSTFAAKAQQYEAGIMLGAQVPTGELKEFDFKPGLGFNLFVRQNVAPNVKIGLNLGVSRFVDETDSDYATRFTTTTAAVEYYFLSERKLKAFVGTDVGFFNYADIYSSGGSKDIDKIMLFGLSPNIGVTYEVAENINLIGNLKYNYGFVPADYPMTWFGINVGASFSFGK